MNYVFRVLSFFAFTAIIYSQAPVADLSPGSQQTGTVPHTVNFTDLSTNSPTSWVWHFGDGHVDTVQNPSHTYTQSGIYTVSLFATNSSGSDMAAKQALIHVQTHNVVELPDEIDLNNNLVITRVYGAGVSSYSGCSVSSGDINGDGIDDAIIGASHANAAGGTDAGKTYIIYGSTELDNTGSIDLSGPSANTTHIMGDDYQDYFGISVSSGDINGDGFADVIAGAKWADHPCCGNNAGETYIIYGSAEIGNTSIIDLNNAPSNITRIYGNEQYDYFGMSVSSGDINGDGFVDIFVGASIAGDNEAGMTFIIYGSAEIIDTDAIDLQQTPSNVTRIYGIDQYDGFGTSISSGDINGDGFQDVIIGASGADPVGGTGAGETYIIYGSIEIANNDVIYPDSTLVNITCIYGDDSHDNAGHSVSSGDINGDGYTDVLIGAYQATPVGGTGAGETYIIYGSEEIYNTASIDLDSEALNITRIYGDDSNDKSGYRISSGDINGDGFFDIIIGAIYADQADGADAGETYIIYGSEGIADTICIDLNSTHADVTRIYGKNSNDLSGSSLASGDINGDGYADAIIGARTADPNGYLDAGETYIIYGGKDPVPPQIPQNLDYLCYNDSIRISWDQVPDDDLLKYILYRGPAEAPTDSVASINGQFTTFLDADVVMGTQYYYCLRAVDSSGNFSDYSNGISAFAVTPPESNFLPEHQLSGIIPFTVSFQDNSTNSPTSYVWHFGDGTVDTTQNPTHTYTKTGIYSVSLLVTNNGGSDMFIRNALVHVSKDNVFNLPAEVDLDLMPGMEYAKTTRILGDDEGDESGISVASGDINGDGFMDVIIGAMLADTDGGEQSGETYIVYGSTDKHNSLTIDLNETPSDVTRIFGDDYNDWLGKSVSSGDINGDGFSDIIIGAYNADMAKGVTYIVYGVDGMEQMGTIDLNSKASSVTRILGDDAVDYSGYSVSSGDINGDGFSDIIIGAPMADPISGSQAGETYIVYGSNIMHNTTTMDLNNSLTDLTRILGGNYNYKSGWSLSSGDINGDGYSDVIIGTNMSVYPASGETYIVFGAMEINETSIIDLADTTGNVCRIFGDDPYDKSGYSVSSGDVNGDGYIDLIIGAYQAEPVGFSTTGETYIVYGYGGIQNISSIDLGDETLDITRIYGDDDNDQSGYSISSGDINGDGYSDIIIGTIFGDPPGGSDAGETYLIYGAADLNNSPIIDLNETPSSVTRIFGDDYQDYSGISVSSGDVNGDGYCDIIIGSNKADPPGGENAGETYIIYGGIDAEPPAIPQNLIANVHNDSVRLNWDPVFDVDMDYYKIYRSPVENASDSLVIINNSVTSFLDLDVEPRNTYYYRITAVDTAGNSSGFSNEVSATTIVLPGIDFSPGEQISGTVPLTINFTDQTTVNPTEWIWHFGDGATSRDQNPSHTYNQSGIYTVSLLATNSGGAAIGARQALVWVQTDQVVNIPANVNMDTSPGNEVAKTTRITGADANDYLGSALASGDFNGDGFGDALIGSPSADPPGGSDGGEVYLIFGSPSVHNNIEVDMSNSKMSITNIYGDDLGDQMGWSVASGDINGDGYDDAVIGAWGGQNPDYESYAGETYIIYGSETLNTVSSIDMNSGKIPITRIYGENSNDYSGYSLYSGDVNGDGYKDVIIGAYKADPAGVSAAGITYIVYGMETIMDTSIVDLGDSNLSVTRIHGDYGNDNSGKCLSAGDLNGDGLMDVIIGAPNADGAIYNEVGESYIVYGKIEMDTTVVIDLSDNPENVTRITGLDMNDFSGSYLATADLNGDGYDDLFIGANGASDWTGETYVIYGSNEMINTSTVDLNSKQATVSRIYGVNEGEWSGVVSGGDINGDGFDDLFIGGLGADVYGGIGAGITYILYGSESLSDSNDIFLAENPAWISSIIGDDESDNFGNALSNGDLNGDGFTDLIIGAYRATSPEGYASAGEVYFIYGGIDAVPPSVPEDLTAVAFSDSIYLNWQSGYAADLWYYNIYRGRTAELELADSLNSTFIAKYEDNAVLNDSTYYYWVTAVDSSGNESGYSQSTSAIPNASPIWMAIPDTAFLEDDTLQFDLDSWVSDINNPDSTLILSAMGQKLLSDIDPLTHILTLFAAPDTSGIIDQIIITATDTYGLSSSDTILVSVIAVNDPPYFITQLPSSTVDEDDFGAIVINRMEDYINDVDRSDHLIFTGDILDAGLDSIDFSMLSSMKASNWTASGTNQILSVKRSTMRQKQSKLIDRKNVEGIHPETQSILTGSFGVIKRTSLNTEKRVTNTVLDTTVLIVYPTENFNGDVRVIITATDDSLATVSDTLLLSIEPVNDIPVIVAIPDTEINEDDTLTLGISAYDLDMDILTYSVVPDINTFTITSEDTVVSIIPDLNWNGTSEISIQAADQDTFATTQFTLTVAPVNDPPGDFNLIAPMDSLISITPAMLSQNLTFVWGAAEEVDGDTIMYTLEITDSVHSIIHSEISGNAVIISYDSLLWDIHEFGFSSLHGSWTVMADDGYSATYSNTLPLTIDGSLVKIAGEPGIPDKFALHSNYPNPFNPVTTLRYDIPEETHVTLTIYDVMGREIRTLVNGNQKPGYKRVKWNATDDFGKPVGAGMYLYQIRSSDYIQTKKMILLK